MRDMEELEEIRGIMDVDSGSDSEETVMDGAGEEEQEGARVQSGDGSMMTL